MMEAIHAGHKTCTLTIPPFPMEDCIDHFPADEVEQAMKPSKRLRGIHPDLNKINAAAKANGSTSKLSVKTNDIPSASTSKTPPPTTGEKRKHRDMYIEARSPVSFSGANTPVPSSRATRAPGLQSTSAFRC